MQLSFDSRENSVPTILLLFQKPLSAQGRLEVINEITPEHGYAKIQQKSYKLVFINIALKKIFDGAAATVAIIYVKKAWAPSPALYVLPCVVAVTCYWLRFLLPNTEFATLTPLEQSGRLWAKILITALANGFPVSSILVESYPVDSYYPTLVYTTGIPKKSVINDQRSIYEGKDALVLTLIYVGIVDYVAYSSDLYSSIFGVGERSVAVGIFLFLYVIPPANVVVCFALNAKTRLQELRADAVTKGLGYGAALRIWLLKFMDQNQLSIKIPNDPWFSAYRLSQPSYPERLDAI